MSDARQRPSRPPTSPSERPGHAHPGNLTGRRGVRAAGGEEPDINASGGLRLREVRELRVQRRPCGDEHVEHEVTRAPGSRRRSFRLRSSRRIVVEQSKGVLVERFNLERRRRVPAAPLRGSLLPDEPPRARTTRSSSNRTTPRSVTIAMARQQRWRAAGQRERTEAHREKASLERAAHGGASPRSFARAPTSRLSS